MVKLDNHNLTTTLPNMKSIKEYNWTELYHYKLHYFPFHFDIITAAPIAVMDKAVDIFIGRQEDQDNVANIEDCLIALGYDAVVSDSHIKEITVTASTI